MLRHFSITQKGGLQIFSYEPKDEDEPLTDSLVDSQMLSGILQAIQILSETIGMPIRQINFSGIMLYVKTFGDLYLRLLVEEKLDEGEVERYLEQIAEETMLFLADDELGESLSINKNFRKKIEMILTSLTQDTLVGAAETPTGTDVVSKIVLVGLANAGKTSVKNMFFENWSSEMVRNIKPTIGVEVSSEFLEFLHEKIVIMDLGGQVAYRKQHLSQDEVWKQISAIIFVVDIQDSDSFEEARDYMREIWQIVSRVNKEKPRLSIFFHKYDGSIRDALQKNLDNALIIFEEFLAFSAFYMTTIDNLSSNIAMIRALYFSLPTTILKRLFEEEFLEHFETDVLPGLAEMVRDEKFYEVFEEIKPKLRDSGKKAGKKYGLSLQKAWLDNLMGQQTPLPRLLSSKPLKIAHKGQSLLITIPDWIEQGFPKAFTTVLLDAMLEGILKTLHLGSPKIVEETEEFTTWKVNI